MAVLRFAWFLHKASGKNGNWLFLGAILVGLMQVLIMAELMHAVSSFAESGNVPRTSYFIFAAAIVVYYLTYRRTTTISMDVAHNFIADSRKNIARGIAEAKYQDFLKLIRTDIYAALSANAALITESARFMPNCLAAGVVLVFALAYAASVSGAAALVIAFMFALVIAAFQLMERQNRDYRNDCSAAEGQFMKGLESLFNGFVELKMNVAKRRFFLKRKLLRYAAEADVHRRKYEAVNMNGNALYAILNHLPSGIIAFVLPHFIKMETADMLRLIAVSMFATPALVNLAMFEPLTASSMETIQGIEKVLGGFDAIRDAEVKKQEPPAFERDLTITDLTFRYDETPEKRSLFNRFKQDGQTLTAREFILRRGEIVFVHGWNGAGKTTFFHLVAGLFKPAGGVVKVDDQLIWTKTANPEREAEMDRNLANYRGLFSVVFTDFHLFDFLFPSAIRKRKKDRQPGEDKFAVRPEEIERARSLLRLMELGPEAIDVRDDGEFTTTDLSSGQRKRLAVVCALMESRPILLLDEVAADFNPEFREKFYTQLLPRWRDEGYTILAISHDEKYLTKVPDRIIQMKDMTLGVGKAVDKGGTTGA